jgi:hypothetical protein
MILTGTFLAQVLVGTERVTLFRMKGHGMTTIEKAYSQSEGPVARAIEEQTSRLPSDTFLWAAVASMAASALLQASGNRHASLFLGQWAPTLLLFGVYNKLVKQLGSDRLENAL